jgi:hypothetical protein
MPSYPCPKGHDSTDPDFCSVCGAKLQATTPEAAVCPDCGGKREPPGGMFCEICGFNFATGAHGELKPAPPAPPPAPSRHWEVIVTVDSSLRVAESPDPPADFAPLAIPLNQEATLIGRRSERRAIAPEISLDQDDAVSHRHALLNCTPQGALTLRDLGSANGTMLNGAVLPPLTDAELKDGDAFTLGHWTKVTVKAAP